MKVKSYNPFLIKAGCLRTTRQFIRLSSFVRPAFRDLAYVLRFLKKVTQFCAKMKKNPSDFLACFFLTGSNVPLSII